MRMCHVIGMLTFAACVASAGNAPPKAKPAMDELWRRGTCVLSSIVVPAQKASRVPKNLGGAKQIVGRPVSRAGGYRCFATAGDTLYVATDTRLDVFDLAAAKRTASFTPADGRPDSPIDELIVDGPRVWVVARTGLGLVEGGKATAKGLPQFRIARVVPARESVWVVADSGTFVQDRTGGAWRSLPALPTAKTVASQLDRGIWQERWRSATDMMIAQAAAVGGSLYAVSMGTLCRFDDKWTHVSRDAWTLAADGDTLWVLTSKGVERYEGEKVTRYGREQGLAEGRHRRIAVTERAVWVATDGRADPKTKRYVGGGLSRFDRAKGTWSSVTRINNLPVTDISCLEVRDGRLWVSSLVFEKLVVRSAHPGMMHVRRAVPEVTGIGIHHCDLATEQWQSINCPHPKGQPRQILGQRGKALAGRLVPYRALAVAPGKTRLIAMVEMQDPTYYGGRCHSVVSLAQREAPGKPWAAGRAAPLGVARQAHRVRHRPASGSLRRRARRTRVGTRRTGARLRDGQARDVEQGRPDAVAVLLGRHRCGGHQGRRLDRGRRRHDQPARYEDHGVQRRRVPRRAAHPAPRRGRPGAPLGGEQGCQGAPTGRPVGRAKGQGWGRRRPR